MNVWIITKEGFYRHEICGIYTTPEQAMKDAHIVANQDIDSYHEYRVSGPFMLNEPVVVHQGDPLEPSDVFTCRKEKQK